MAVVVTAVVAAAGIVTLVEEDPAAVGAVPCVITGPSLSFCEQAEALKIKKHGTAAARQEYGARR
jgi:hypothetical protein